MDDKDLFSGLIGRSRSAEDNIQETALYAQSGDGPIREGGVKQFVWIRNN
jgi:hypothetical protein